MSQNSSTLLLFFDQKSTQDSCISMLQSLNNSDNEKAKPFAELLGIDITNTWQEEWFNHEITPRPLYIRIDYDSSTGYHLPLSVLQQFFSCGLKHASIEIFYDQVGEFAQYHFMDRKLVQQDALIASYPMVEDILSKEFECSGDDLGDDDSIDAPVTIEQPIKDEKQQKVDSEEMVNALLGLAEISKETGSDPLEVMKSAMIMRALFKGLFFALLFGVCTVLLFKGMWLWISLAIVLAIALPLYYVSLVTGEFDDEDDIDEGEEAC